MPRSSCISHPSLDFFLPIRRSYVVLCDGDFCAAGLIATFEYFTNGLKDTGHEPWIHKTHQALSEQMVELYSISSIQKSLKMLEAAGIITVREPVKGAAGHFGTTGYRFNYETVQEMLRTCQTTMRKITDGPQVKLPTAVRKITDGPQVKLPTVECHLNLKEEVEVEIEVNPVSEVLSSKNETNTKAESQNSPARAIQQHSYSHMEDLYLADPIDVFIKDAYSRERKASFTITRKSDASLIESLHALEADGGPVPVRAAFIRFLRDENAWLVENGWPIRKFMKDWMLYDHSLDDVPDEVAVLQGTANAGQLPRIGSIPEGGSASVVPPAPKSDSSPPEALNLGWRWYVDRWDELAPSAKVKVPVSYAKENTFKTNELAEIWPDICRRVEEHYQSDEDPSHWLTLDWILQEKNGVPNWRGFLARKPKKAKKARSAAEVLFGKKAVTSTK